MRPLFLAVVLCLGVHPAFPGQTGYYPLDEGADTVAVDGSGYGRNGALYGGTWMAEGHAGGALQLNGTSDYIAFGTDDFDFYDQFTVCAWIYVNGDAQGGSRQMIAARGAYYSPFMFALEGHSLRGMVRGADANAYITSTARIGWQEWCHVALSYSSGAIRLYVNGQLNKTDTTVHGVLNSGGDQAFYVGCSGSLTDRTNFFNGILDDVRMYDVALYASEITALYNGEYLPVYADDSLAVRAILDGNAVSSGTTVASVSVTDPVRGRITELDLSGLGLTVLPDTVLALGELVRLNVSDNQLVRLPSAIHRLAKLEALNLYGNRLTDLPERLMYLPALSALDVGGNELCGLISNIQDWLDIHDPDWKQGQNCDNPFLDYAPAALSFGPAAVGTLKTMECAVTNRGFGTLVVGEARLTGGAPFAVSDTSGALTVAPDDTVRFTVTFSPAGAASYRDTFRIGSNDTLNPLVLIPVSGCAGVPQMDVFPASVFIGARPGMIGNASLTVTNAGAADLTVTSARLADGSVIGVSGADGASVVVPGASLAFTFELLSEAADTVLDTFVIVSDDPDPGEDVARIPVLGMVGMQYGGGIPYVGGWEADNEYAAITPACMEILKAKRFLQSTRSNGQNVMSGLVGLGMDAVQYAPAQGTPIPGDAFDGPGIVYYMCDINPQINRIREFESFFRDTSYTSNWTGRTYDYDFSGLVDAAMLGPRIEGDNAAELLAAYGDAMDRLQTDFPGITFVHYTHHVWYPDDVAAKVAVSLESTDETVIANEYNRLYFERYPKGSVPVFDWGDILSTREDGTVCTCESGGELYRMACPEYWNNGHPSTAIIERRLAQGWLVLMSKLYCGACSSSVSVAQPAPEPAVPDVVVYPGDHFPVIRLTDTPGLSRVWVCDGGGNRLAQVPVIGGVVMMGRTGAQLSTGVYILSAPAYGLVKKVVLIR